MMNKENRKTWLKAAAIRALKTVAQTLIATIPAGIVITPAMVQSLDVQVVYVVLAWLITGILAGLVSMLTSIAGLPEVELKEQMDKLSTGEGMHAEKGEGTDESLD